MKAENTMNLRQTNTQSSSDPECQRCHGMLVPTSLQIGPFDATVPSFPTAWRCVNCGALLDRQIAMNQSFTSLNSKSSRAKEHQLKSRRPRAGPRLRLPLIPKI